jgi:hypothetical protein
MAKVESGKWNGEWGMAKVESGNLSFEISDRVVCGHEFKGKKELLKGEYENAAAK